MIWYVIFILIFLVLALAALVDWKRRKNNNYPHISTNPNTKPGDSKNHTMGDNKYTNGGQ